MIEDIRKCFELLRDAPEFHSAADVTKVKSLRLSEIVDDVCCTLETMLDKYTPANLCEDVIRQSAGKIS